MTKKEYFENVDRLLRDTIANMNFNKAELDAVNQEMTSGKYSHKTIQEKLHPKRAEHERYLVEAKENAINKIKEWSEELCAEITESNRLKGEEMTEDAKLLNVGVRLSDIELEAMFDRNSGNPTMEKLICEYARQNEIRIARVPTFKGKIEYDTAKGMPITCHYILKNYNMPSMYQEFFGEGSQMRDFFMSDAQS